MIRSSFFSRSISCISQNDGAAVTFIWLFKQFDAQIETLVYPSGDEITDLFIDGASRERRRLRRKKVARFLQHVRRTQPLDSHLHTSYFHLRRIPRDALPLSSRGTRIAPLLATCASEFITLCQPLERTLARRFSLYRKREIY